ncbi:MAG: creatininase family protein [Pseudomonadota bacterium]
MTEVSWARLKAHELRALAAEGALVILPLASIEQHGPHLPVMTDMAIGEAVALRAAGLARRCPVVVAPAVWSGLSEHHMPFGGTLTVRPETFAALVADLVEAIVRQGFAQILLSNSHGGNIRAMEAAAETVAQRLPATVVATSYASEAAQAITAILEDQPSLMHAEEAETSMMLTLAPELVDARDLASLADGMGPGAGPGALAAGRASYRWRPFAHVTSNGIRGNPARASAEKGERLLQVSAEAIAALIDDPAAWTPAEDRRGSGTAGVPFAGS